MTHLSDDTLLLLAYAELSDADRDAAGAHLAECATCGRRFADLERTRVATDWALAPLPSRRRRWRLWLGALPLAAGVIAVLVIHDRHPKPNPIVRAWSRYAVPELVPIDSMLTRLEQEKLYGMP